MSSEYSAIKSLASLTEKPSTQDVKFIKSEFDIINPESNGPYLSNQSVSFDTSVSHKHNIYADSYLYGSTTFVATETDMKTTLCALKQSALSLISDITIELNNGTSIVNNQASKFPELYNNLMLICDTTKEGVKALETDLDFYPEKSGHEYHPLAWAYAGTKGVSEYTSTPTQTYAEGKVDVLTIATSLNPAFNAGLVSRDACSEKTDTTYRTYQWCIKLKYLHDFFKHLDFPLVGFNMKLKVGFNTGTRALTSTNDITSVSTSTCKLYLKTVVSPTQVQLEELKQLQSGVERVFKFSDYIVWNSGSSPFVSATPGSVIVSRGVVKPKRLFLVGFPAAGLVGGIGHKTYMANSVLKLARMNVVVGSSNLFSHDLDNERLMYEEFCRACGHFDQPDSELAPKMLVDFTTWKNQYRVYAIDLSGVKSTIGSESVAPQIEITYTPGVTGGNIDALCFIEQERICKLKLLGDSTILSIQ